MSYNTVSETPGPRHRTARPHCSLRGRPLAISRRYTLTEELAESCAMKMFTLHADGSHLSQCPQEGRGGAHIRARQPRFCSFG